MHLHEAFPVCQQAQQESSGTNGQRLCLPEGAALQILVSIILPGFMQLVFPPCLPRF